MVKKEVFDPNNTWIFMLKEYERIHNMMVNERKDADTRVNYFLTIVTASIGLLVFLFQASNIYHQILLPATVSILSIQLLYGLIIQNKLTMRTVQLASYREVLVKIQDIFSSNSEIIAGYFDYQREILKLNNTGLRKFVADRLMGNLSDFVALTNSILTGGTILTILIANNQPPDVILIWTITTFILAGTILYLSSIMIRKFIKLRS